MKCWWKKSWKGYSIRSFYGSNWRINSNDEGQLKVYQEQERELQKKLQLAKDKIAKAKEEEIHRTSYQKHLELKMLWLQRKRARWNAFTSIKSSRNGFSYCKKEEEKNTAQKELEALLIKKVSLENELQALLKKKEELKPQLSLLQEEEKK